MSNEKFYTLIGGILLAIAFICMTAVDIAKAL